MKVDPYHTSHHAHAHQHGVYHDHDDCHDGKQIKHEHREKGKADRTHCQHCAKMS